MTSTVSGASARSLSRDSFVDITAARVLDIAPSADGVAVTFDGDLDAAQRDAVWQRITSRDDVDQARRATVRDASDRQATNLPQITAAYVLGDPIPDPVYPPPEPAPEPAPG